MNARRYAAVSLLILLALALTQGAYAGQETTVVLSFERDQFLFDQVRGYDRVHLVDGTIFSQLGAPLLPAQQIRVAIPSGSEAVEVRLRSLDSEKLPGTYRIFPGQPPRRFDGSPPPPFVEPDAQIYAGTSAYPGYLAQLERQTDLAGQQMAVVTVYPLQYVPAEGQLILHRELEVTVESRPGRVSRESYGKFTQRHREHYGQVVRGMVVNPQDVVLDPPAGELSKALPSGDFDHVIITSSSYASYFDDLIEWHNKRGLRDTVMTTSYIYANYSGADDEEKIRNFVIDARSTWGAMYFLMGGEDNYVPFKYRTYYDGESTPSDNYYADYDDDWTCEVYVGRISGSTSTQFATAIDKILNYEQDPPTSDYPLDALLIGMDLDAYTLGQNLKETIDGYIPSRFTVTKVYDSDGTNHLTATIAALNAGQNLVNHADHANSTVLGTGSVNHGWGLYSGNVDALTNNGQPSNVVSLGCWANDMTYNDGIAEHFVISNSNQAGVSFTGNTRSGWGYVGSPASLSGQLDRDWWRGLFSYDQYLLGHALVWSKHQFSHSANINKHCEWTFCLLGDPAMPLWTDTPATLTATHPSTLPVGSSSFLVHVESGGSDVVSAYVCLWKQGDVYLTGTTNIDGDVTFNPSPGNAGTMYVTVTKWNHLPYEGSADVIIGSSDPSVTVTYPNGGEMLSGSATITWTATDPDPGETALLSIDLDYSSNGGGDWTPIATGESNDGSCLWDVSGLPDGSDYLVRATATDPTMRSDSDISNAVFSIDNPGLPAAISDLTATLAVTAIHLSWSAVTEDTGGQPIVVDHYVIYRNSNPGFILAPTDSIASTVGTSYGDPTPDLKDSDTNSYYVVRAVDDYGRKSVDSNRAGEFDVELINEPPAK